MKRLSTAFVLMMFSPAALLAAQQPESTSILKTFSILLVIVAALFATAWVIKKYGPVARVKKTTGLSVTGQVALNPKASLAIVRAGGSVLLLGVTQNNVTLIKDLGKDEFEKAIQDIEENTPL